MEEKEQEQDAEILDAIKSRRKLASDLELAKGIQYTEPLKTRYEVVFCGCIYCLRAFTYSWRPPRYIRERTPEQDQKLRDKYHIIVDGESIPPPIEHFSVSTRRLHSITNLLIIETGHENPGTHPELPSVQTHRSSYTNSNAGIASRVSRHVSLFQGHL